MSTKTNSNNENKQKKKQRLTYSNKELIKSYKSRQKKGKLIQSINYWKPKTRSDCRKMKRPCLFISCKHHLYLDIKEETGSIKMNFPGKEVWELKETCALDIAEKGGDTLENIGEAMNLTREGIRQVELQGLQKIDNIKDREDLIDSYLNWDPN